MPASPDLDALAALLDKMQRPPPYTAEQDGTHHFTIGVKGHPLGYAFSGYCEAADVAGMVAAVNAAPALLARCRELERALLEAANKGARGEPVYTSDYLAWRALVHGTARVVNPSALMTSFECRCCSTSTGEWPQDSLPEGWRRIARIDGPNAICPACVADPTALDGLREDGYEDAHVAHPGPAAGEPKL